MTFLRSVPQTMPHSAFPVPPSQKLLHCYILILIVVQYLAFGSIGFFFDNLLRAGTRSYPPVVIGHFAAGGVICLLVVWRAVSDFIGVRDMPPLSPRPTAWVARASMALLYAVLVALALLGLLAWCFASEVLARGHDLLARALPILIVARIAVMTADGFVVGRAARKRRQSGSN
ncbi:hypothetical protein [Amaricoccus macauensis]|uniref:hypothetical protein n=1 Tax=Amaricoccus macauensis TaxID=57001 RepID=UPI003C7C5D74